MNLDNKYSKLQVYNKPPGQSEDEDESDLANFLSDLPADRLAQLTGIVEDGTSSMSTASGSSTHAASASFVSNYELILKQLLWKIKV